MEHVTTAGAGAAVVAPWWMPVVHTGYLIADHARDAVIWVTPFAALTWLIMQIYYKHKREHGQD